MIVGLLLISTFFWVVHAPESWSKKLFGPFSDFVSLLFSTILSFLAERKKKIPKRWLVNKDLQAINLNRFYGKTSCHTPQPCQTLTTDYTIISNTALVLKMAVGLRYQRCSKMLALKYLKVVQKTTKLKNLIKNKDCKKHLHGFLNKFFSRSKYCHFKLLIEALNSRKKYVKLSTKLIMLLNKIFITFCGQLIATYLFNVIENVLLMLRTNQHIQVLIQVKFQLEYDGVQ